MRKLSVYINFNLFFFKHRFFYFFKNFWFYFSKSPFFLNRFFFLKNVFSVFYYVLFLRKNFKKKLKKKIFARLFNLKYSKRIFKLRKILIKKLKFFFTFFKKNYKFFSGSLKKEEEKKKINHFKRKIALSKLFKISSIVSKNLIIYKFKFVSNFFTKFDPLFFSFFFNKLLSKFMLNGKKFLIFFIFYTILLSLKYFTALKPIFLMFSSLESSRAIIGHIPKNLSGKIHIVPTYLYFDKQFKISLKLFISNLRKKQEYISTSNFFSTNNSKMKRFVKISSFFFKNQKLYFSKFSKFTQRKNLIFDILKKNYYLYLSNRSNLQYRWR